MRRDTSARVLRTSQLTQSPHEPDFKKFIYINDQTITKDKTTIFHSPYKNGKRNQDYSNPTFMSSDVFYCKDYTLGNTSESKPRVALILNNNQLKKQQLSLNRSLKKSSSVIDFKKVQPSKVSPAHLKESIIRTINNNLHMTKELTALKQLNKSQRDLKIQKSRVEKNQQPVYLQNNTFEETKKKHQRKKELYDHLKQAMKIKQRKKQVQTENKKLEKKIIDAESNRFYANVMTSLQFQRQRARLLSELLKQQINKRV